MKIKEIIKRIEISEAIALLRNFLFYMFILSSLLAEASNKKNNIDDEPGYVTEALAEQKVEDMSTSKQNSKNNTTKNSSKLVKQKPLSKPIDRHDNNSSLKKKPKNKKTKDHETKWLPEMGENPDSKEAIEKNIKENKKKQLLVNELSSLNYNIYIPPKELYSYTEDGFNNHLPKIYFQSDYLKMIINAIDHNNYNNLRTVLDSYSFINEPHQNGDTILMYAIQNHSLNSARILLAKGAHVDAVNNSQRTALHYAAALGDVESIKLLLSMGANPKAIDELNMTPIDYAKVAQQYKAEWLLSQY